MQYTIPEDTIFDETRWYLEEQGLNPVHAEKLAQQALIAKRAPSVEKIRHAEAMRRLSTYIHLFD